MLTTIVCPTCQKKLRLPEGTAGKRVRCPGCKAVFITPAAASEPPLLSVTAAPLPLARPAPRVVRPDDDQLDDDYPRRRRDADGGRPRRRMARAAQPRKSNSTAIILTVVGLVFFVGVLGVAGIAGLIYLGQQSAAKNRKPFAGGMKPVPLEVKNQREKEVKDAFKNLDPVDRKDKIVLNPPAGGDLAAELKPLFDELGAAFRTRDTVRATAYFDVDRLFDEMLNQGDMPPQFVEHRAEFVKGASEGLSRQLRGSATTLAWETFEIKHVKQLAPNEVAVIVRLFSKNQVTRKMRWSATKRDGSWKVFDWEDLDVGMRASTLMLSMVQSAGVDNAEMRRLKSATDDVYDALKALGSNPNIVLAEQKLRNVDGVKLPRPLEALRLLALGTVNIHRGQNKAALEDYDKAAALHPDMPILDMLRANAHSRLGEWDKALKYVEAYRALLGDDNAVCYQKGIALAGLGRTAEAATQYRKALDYNPKNADAYFGLIRVMTPNDNRDDLAERFAKLDLHQHNFQVFADDCKLARDGPTLEILCVAMRKIDPNHPKVDYYEALAKAWNNKSKEAVALFKSALAKEDDPVRRQEFASDFLQSTFQADVAVEVYAVMPDAREAFRVLAAGLKKSYRQDDLRQLVALHAKKHADDNLLPFYQGEVYNYDGKYKLAAKAFDLGMSKLPDQQTLNEFRSSRVVARYYTGQGLAAYQDNTASTETFTQLAQLCFSDDNDQLLEQLLAELAKNSPGDMEELRWGSRLKIKQGDTAQGIKLFQAALAQPSRQDQKQTLISNFLFDMAEAGKPLDAYAAAPDASYAFQIIARRLLDNGDKQDLEKLMNAHRRRHADDLWLEFYAAQLLMEEKQWDQAAGVLFNVWKRAGKDLQPRFQSALVSSLYKAGKIQQALTDVDPKQETYRQLVRLLLIDKKGKELEALVASQQAQGIDTADLLFNEAQAKVLLKQPAEAAKLLDQAFKKQSQQYLRQMYVRTIALAMLDDGNALQGYRTSPDQVTAFDSLAREFTYKKNYKELTALVQEHAKLYPEDSRLLLHQGELHLGLGELQQAEQSLAKLQAKATARDPWFWQVRNLMFKLKVKQGKTVAAYQEAGRDTKTFQSLAAACIQEKNGPQLEALVAAQRQDDPDDADGWWDVEVRWLNKDYSGALKLIEEDRKEGLIAPRHKWQAENYLVRCLVKLNRHHEAVKRAEIVGKRQYGNRVLLIYTLASRGDLKGAMAAAEKAGQRRYLLEDCYRDEDLGPILQSDAFREFRERFPEPKNDGRYGDRYDDDYDG